MNVTVIDSGNTAQVIESNSTVSIVNQTPFVEVSESSTVIEVTQAPSRVEVVEIGHTVTIQSAMTSVVEVQSQGPKGDPANIETGPSFTYVGGVVSRIDYDSGNFKVFTYSGGNVTRIDYVQPTKTTRKDFSYNVDGTLAEITQTEI